MSRKQHSGIFMMEMITVVFFFILCAGICILVFAKGDRMSREAADLNESVFIAQSVAEVWKKEGLEGLKKHFDAESAGNGTDAYRMKFGRNAYTATLSSNGTEEAAEITVSREENRIYALSVRRHERKQSPREAADG